MRCLRVTISRSDAVAGDLALAGNRHLTGLQNMTVAFLEAPGDLRREQVAALAAQHFIDRRLVLLAEGDVDSDVIQIAVLDEERERQIVEDILGKLHALEIGAPLFLALLRPRRYRR